MNSLRVGSRETAVGRASFLILLALLWLVISPVQADAVVETEHARAELISEAGAIRPGETFWVALRLRLQPGWHTYWKNPGDSGEATQLHWRLPEGFQAGEPRWPYPSRLPLPPLMNFGYSGQAWLLQPITAPQVLDGREVTLTALATWLVCQEDCIPEEGEVGLTLPVATGASPPSPHAAAFAEVRRRLPQPLAGSRLEVVDADTLRLHVGRALAGVNLQEAWFFPEEYGQVDHPAPQPLTITADGPVLSLKRGEFRDEPLQRMTGVLVVTQALADGPAVESFGIDAALAAADAPVADPSATTTPPRASRMGLALAILLAVGGGLLLNLMPCVFPVLSLKALHLVEMAQVNARQVRLGGLAFSAGVLLTFLGIATVLLLLRASGEAVGWGFQLQSPAFVLALVWLTFSLGLWLSGVWSLGDGLMGLGQGLAEKRGLVGTFFTGVLAVVVATPCTAPFMGAALGYALAQPAVHALAVFLALGLGLALPWLLLAYFPALRRLLPWPGAWMERFKQLLAFPMYATAAWLLWVLNQQTDASALAYALTGLLSVALAAWLWQSSRHATRAWRLLGSGVGLGALALLAALLWNLPNGHPAPATQADSPHQAQVYSDALLEELRAEGRPVLINFTAAWCITCQVNDRIALSTEAVVKAMAERDVAYLKADWTRRDPVITRTLEAHGRSGVPMYLLYPPGGGAPRLLPSVLTESLVLEHLAQYPVTQPTVQP